MNNGGCEHNCTNLVGSYNCSCFDGYILDLDGHLCNGYRYQFLCRLTITFLYTNSNQTLMSVKKGFTCVPPMLLVPTPREATIVHVTLDITEMDSPAIVTIN